MCVELQAAAIGILRLKRNSLESWAKVRISCLDSSASWVNKFPFFNLSAWIEFPAFLQKKKCPNNLQAYKGLPYTISFEKDRADIISVYS